VCTTKPEQTPVAVATPATAPWAIERDMTRIMSCPGVTMSTSDAATNSTQLTSIMAASCGLSVRHCRSPTPAPSPSRPKTFPNPSPGLPRSLALSVGVTLGEKRHAEDLGAAANQR